MSNRKTVTTNTQPRFYIKLPIKGGDRQCMMYKRGQECQTKTSKGKKVLLVGCWREEAKDPPNPVPLVQFLFYAIRTNMQAEKQKKMPCADGVCTGLLSLVCLVVVVVFQGVVEKIVCQISNSFDVTVSIVDQLLDFRAILQRPHVSVQH